MNRAADAAKESRRSKGPPRLQFHFAERIKFLLLVNIVPLIVGIGLAIGYMQGMVHVVGFDKTQHGFAAFVVLASCILLGLSWWIIVPIAKWLRNYPRWFFHRESKIVWFLPYCFGSLAWAIAWIACMLAGIVAFIAIISMIYVGFFGVPDAVTESEAQSNNGNAVLQRAAKTYTVI